MSNFDWELTEKMILSETQKEGDHIVVTRIDTRLNQKEYLSVSINGKKRYIHHMLYICQNKLDLSVKLTMKKICNHDKCVNLEHWVDTKSDNAIYKIGSYYLKENSVKQDTCQLWTGALNVEGYGYGHFNDMSRRAHIISMFVHLKIDKLPEGQIVRHICKNKNCIAIEHLELGTHKENSLDRIRDGTMRRGEEHPNASIDEKKH